jgi:hypothetical protein
MHENKIFFFVFEIRIFYFLCFFINFRENQVFYIGFVSYSVSLRPNIK